MLGDLRHFGDLLTRNARLDGDGEGLVMGGERLNDEMREVLGDMLIDAGDQAGAERVLREALTALGDAPDRLLAGPGSRDYGPLSIVARQSLPRAWVASAGAQRITTSLLASVVSSASKSSTMAPHARAERQCSS